MGEDYASLGQIDVARRPGVRLSVWRMASQLALFPGVVPAEAGEAPVACNPPAAAEPAPAPFSSQQMGLFDAQVRRLRAALDAIANADLPSAVSLLAGLPPELDPGVASMQHRAAELLADLQHLDALPQPAQVAAHLELGRALAVESEPWSSLGRTLIGRAGAGLGPAEGALAGRLFMEAGMLERARSVLLAAGPPTAATLFALGDVESARGDRSAARRYYRDALLHDPFDAAFDAIADADVRALPDVAELEAEVDSDPRAWCAPVGMIAGILPRPNELTGELPMPADAGAEKLAALARAREFVDALVRAGAPDVHKNRDALLDARRCMKRASAPLFAWYMGRLAGAS